MKQRSASLALTSDGTRPSSFQRGHAMDRQAIARPSSDLCAFALTESLHTRLEGWTRRRLGKTDHERRVAQVAGALFDLTHDLHNLSRRSRSILLAAALVH